MSAKLPLSVFIIARNEADRIAQTISSVSDLADEIIVIDSGSTDDTMEVSKSLGAKVFFHTWEGYGVQKRFGESQCYNDWLLNLDADEELTPALSAEIKTLFASGAPPQSGYLLQVRDLLPGEQKLAPLAHTNFVLRLYDRRVGRFSKSPVHDSVIMPKNMQTPMLAAPVLHRSFRDLSHAIEKMNSYTTAQAENLLKTGLSFPVLRLIVEFPLSFCKAYFIRLYILRGGLGLAYAMFYAYGRVARLAKYLEMKKIDIKPKRH